MKKPSRMAVLAALALIWGAFAILRAAPTWLPHVSFIRALVESVMMDTSEGAGVAYAIEHHSEMIFKTAALLAVQACLGAAAVAWLAPAARPGWLVLWGAGLPVMSLVTLGWGLVGLVFPSVVLLFSLAAAGLSLNFLWRRGTFRLPAPGRAEGPRDPWTTAGWVVCGLAVLLLAGLAVAPDTSWDALVYHLRLPAFFVAEHRIFHFPANHFSAFPLAAEMQGTWLMLLGGLDRMGGGESAKLYHLSAAVVAALAARSVARRIVLGEGNQKAAEFAGVLAAALTLLPPLTGTIAVRAYNDYVQAALAGLALLLVLERGPGARPLAALLCGAALSAKYTGLLILLPAALLLFRFNWRPYAVSFACFAPWLAKNALLTGDPVAPFFARLLGVPPQTAFQFSAYTGSVAGMSLNIPVLGSVVSGLMREPSGEMLSELLFILPAVLFVFPLRGRDGRQTALFFGAFLAAWYVLVPSARFFATGLAPLAALASAGFAVFAAKQGSWPRWILGLLLALNLIRLPLAHLSLFGPLPFILGRETVEHNLTRSLYPAPYYEALAMAANKNLPANARLLVMIDIKAHYIWRRVYHDFQYVNPGLFLRWLRDARGDVPALVKRLKREGITHVLVIYQRTRDVGRHYSFEGSELAAAADFLASYTKPVLTTNGAEVLKVYSEPQKRRPLDSYFWMLFVHAENLMLEHREDASAALLRETLRRAPWLGATKAYLGMALARRGNYREAMPMLSAAARSGGATAPFASFALGQIRQKQGDFDGAEEAFRTAARLNPEFADPRFALGQLLAGQGRYIDALTELRQAAKLAPDHPEYAATADQVEREMAERGEK